MAGKRPFKPKIIGDYEFDEVASALQKMIRRGKEYEAVYWAYLLHQSGYGRYLFRRLSIICAEDIGNGDPMAAVVLSSIQQSWLVLHKHNKEAVLYKFLLAVQAVLYLCRAKKTREDDSLLNLINYRWMQGERLEIPEIAIDPHTAKGKKTYGKFDDLKDGKEEERLDRWYGESSIVKNEAYEDKWHKSLKEIRYERAKKETSN